MNENSAYYQIDKLMAPCDDFSLVFRNEEEKGRTVERRER
jgi:hypothetical protein